jgi:hypothetical protein
MSGIYIGFKVQTHNGRKQNIVPMKFTVHNTILSLIFFFSVLTEMSTLCPSVTARSIFFRQTKLQNEKVQT